MFVFLEKALSYLGMNTSPLPNENSARLAKTLLAESQKTWFFWRSKESIIRDIKDLTTEVNSLKSSFESDKELLSDLYKLSNRTSNLSKRLSPTFIFRKKPKEDVSKVINDLSTSIISHLAKANLPRDCFLLPETLPLEKSHAKMHKNGEKAIKEHEERAEACYLSVKESRTMGTKALINFYEKELAKLPSFAKPDSLEEILPSSSSITKAKKSPVTTTYTESAEKGRRPTMEDAYFVLETDQGILGAVFDGHGGDIIAKEASKFFEGNFHAYLKEAKGNIREAFEKLFIKANKQLQGVAGTTAVLSYIDYKTHAIYTATLGDSETRIYREKQKRLLPIALSCIRDWSSKKDKTRAGDAIENPKEKNVKELRVQGLNVSRALGDSHIPQVSSKPKISMNLVKPGDRVIIACDGLWDYVFEKEIADVIKNKEGDMAKNLTTKATRAFGKDNITVIAIDVK